MSWSVRVCAVFLGPIWAAAIPGCATTPSALYTEALKAGYDADPEPLIAEGPYEALRQVQSRLPAQYVEGDGLMSAEEWDRRGEKFAFVFDLDGDGALSWPEYAQLHCGFLRPEGEYRTLCLEFRLGQFYEADISGDRLLSRVEYQPITRVNYSRHVRCEGAFSSLFC